MCWPVNKTVQLRTNNQQGDQDWDVSKGVQVQELLLILEDHWRRNKDMQGVPIYQASGLATKALSVYQAYIEMMNEDIRTAFDQVIHGLNLPAGSPLSLQPLLVHTSHVQQH